MSETDNLGRAIVQAIADAVAALPVQSSIGKITESGDSYLAVTLPAGRTKCELTGSVTADMAAHQPVSPQGSEALVHFVKGRAIATSIIWTGA